MNRNILPCFRYKIVPAALLCMLLATAFSAEAQQDRQQDQQQQLQVQQSKEDPQQTQPPTGKTIAAMVRSYAALLKLGGVKRVYLEDFRDPNGKVTPFGAWLAAQFASAPGNPWAPIEIIDRNTVEAKLKLHDNPEMIELNAEEAMNLSISLKARIVGGSYGAAENGIGISLTDQAPRDGGFAFGKIAITDDIKSHLSAPIESLVPADGIFTAEEGGVPNPKCQVCPSPQYDPAAARRGVQGSVILRAVIDPAGHLLSVAVEKKLDPALDQIALDTVSKWTFKPPVNVDGKPITVRTPISVRFRLDK
jgi:TonB family protein